MAVSPYSDLPVVCSVTTNFLAQNINYAVKEDSAAIGTHKPPWNLLECISVSKS